MRALTLWRPWDEAICLGPKAVENRPWKPWKSVHGQMIAIHAGMHYDPEGARFCAGQGFRVMSQDESDRGRAGAIVGVARVVGCLWEDREGDLFSDPDTSVQILWGTAGYRVEVDGWFFGPFGWLLADRRSIPPIIHPGARGLWTLPATVETQILNHLDAF